MKKKQKRLRTKFDVLRELRGVTAKLERPEEAGKVAPRLNPVELIRRRTLLREELKLFDRRSATGEEGEALRKHWKRQAEENQKKIDAQKKKDAELLKKAKEEVKEKLSIKELEALLKKKRKNETKKPSL